MRRLIIIPFFLISATLLAQYNAAQIQGEWLPASKGPSSNHIFRFKEGKIESEFIRNTNYIVKGNHLIIHENYYPEKDGAWYKELKEKGHITELDTTKFLITRLDSDSLVVIPQNLAAKQFSYEFNFSNILSFSDSSIKEPIKFYRRELSFKKNRI